MSYTNLHPIFVANKQPHLYSALLRTYLELGIDYWLDMPFDQGRIRLTNILTGEYIIYGPLGTKATELDVGIDEQLHMNVPAGKLRVKLDRNTFVTVDIDANLVYRGVQRKWCIFTCSNNTTVSYDFVRFNLTDLSSIRTQQYAALEKAQERYAERHLPF